MSDLPRISFVIPAYNEAGGILETLQRITKTLSALPNQTEVIVVNDGSSDYTAEVLEELLLKKWRTAAGGAADKRGKFGARGFLGLPLRSGDQVIGAMGLGEWLEAAMVAFLFSVALFLEQWSVGRARQAIASLMNLNTWRRWEGCR